MHISNEELAIKKSSKCPSYSNFAAKWQLIASGTSLMNNKTFHADPEMDKHNLRSRMGPNKTAVHEVS